MAQSINRNRFLIVTICNLGLKGQYTWWYNVVLVKAKAWLKQIVVLPLWPRNCKRALHSDICKIKQNTKCYAVKQICGSTIAQFGLLISSKSFMKYSITCCQLFLLQPNASSPVCCDGVAYSLNMLVWTVSDHRELSCCLVVVPWNPSDHK